MAQNIGLVPKLKAERRKFVRKAVSGRRSIEGALPQQTPQISAPKTDKGNNVCPLKDTNRFSK
jgi:hypothetical protein